MTIEKINETVKNFLVEDLEIEEDKIVGSARLKEDLGIDSLEVVDVVVLVEDQFGYKMKPEDFRTLITLDDFCQFIQQHVA
jgi:acyl carrier protein